MSRIRIIAGGLALGAALVADGALGAAGAACSAQDVQAAEGPANCPASGTCRITKVHGIGDLCTLDFSGRDVVVKNTGVLDGGANRIILKAANLTIEAGGLVTGTDVASGPVAPTIGIAVSGALTVLRSSTTKGKIRITTSRGHGTSRPTLYVVAAGDARIAGEITANAGTSTAMGGVIRLQTGGAVTTSSGFVLAATGGARGFGGEIEVSSGGAVDLASAVDVSGGWGLGTLDVAANGPTRIRGVNASGTSQDGDGGSVDIETASGDVEVLADIRANGSSYTCDGETCAGGGGSVTIVSDAGNVTLSASVQTRGASIGDAGDQAYGASGIVTLSKGAALDASGCGGAWGIDIYAGGDVVLDGNIDATGVRGCDGSPVTVVAGDWGSGNVSLTSTIVATGGTCDADDYCGVGGDISLQGCAVTVSSSSKLTNRGTDSGGATSLTARTALEVHGSINATGAQGGADGSNALTYGAMLNTSGSTIAPAAAILHAPICTAPGVPAGCLAPCSG